MKKETSNTTGRFTEAELKSRVRESRAFWASPEGQATAAKQEREKRSRKLSPTKFPSIAARGSTKPLLVGMTGPQARTAHCKNILARVERNTPKTNI